MARKPRIEFAGAVYHVSNRGKSRRTLFGQPGPADVFERTLLEACRRCGWQLAAYCLMGDRYDLALTTPRGNLVEGMQWLQSTFANSLKRNLFPRGEVFAGRYRAVLVEPGPFLRPLVDYIHLAPVRGALRSVYNLENYPWSSFPKYLDPSIRPSCLTCHDWLAHSGGLTDEPAGWEEYRASLAAILTLDAHQRETLFGRMDRGWVLGSNEYRQTLRPKLHPSGKTRDWGGKDLRAMNETEWETLTAELLKRLGKSSRDIAAARKSAEWKAAVAFHLKQRTSATNPWLSRRLNMGPPAMTSRLATAFGRLPPETQTRYARILVDKW